MRTRGRICWCVMSSCSSICPVAYVSPTVDPCGTAATVKSAVKGEHTAGSVIITAGPGFTVILAGCEFSVILRHKVLPLLL
jgi:hypothetical protein